MVITGASRHFRLKAWTPKYPQQHAGSLPRTRAGRGTSKPAQAQRRRAAGGRGSEADDESPSRRSDSDRDGFDFVDDRAGGETGDAWANAPSSTADEELRKRKETLEAWERHRDAFRGIAFAAVPLLRSEPFKLPGLSDITAACTCASCLLCGGADISPADPAFAMVVYVSARATVELKVPLYHCDTCHTNFHQHPVSIGAFPATPVRSVNLFDRGGDDAVWIEMRALELYFVEQFKVPEMSEEVFCFRGVGAGRVPQAT